MSMLCLAIRLFGLVVLAPLVGCVGGGQTADGAAVGLLDASQLVTFVGDFARQALAAFLL